MANVFFGYESNISIFFIVQFMYFFVHKLSQTYGVGHIRMHNFDFKVKFKLSRYHLDIVGVRLCFKNNILES